MSDFESNEGRDVSRDDPLAGALDRWANDAAGYRPLDTDALAVLTPPNRRTAGVVWKAVAAFAAAAVFLFALAQVSFTVTLGDATLRWGTSATTDVGTLSTQLMTAEGHIAQLSQQLSTHAEAINTVAAQNVLLSDSLQTTAIELVQRQELESAARVYDMQHLAKMVSYEP